MGEKKHLVDSGITKYDIYAHHFNVVDGILYLYNDDDCAIYVIKDWISMEINEDGDA